MTEDVVADLKYKIEELNKNVDSITQQLNLLEETLSTSQFRDILQELFGIRKKPKTTKHLLKLSGVTTSDTSKCSNTKRKKANKSSFAISAKAAQQIRSSFEKTMTPIEREIMMETLRSLLEFGESR